MQQLTWPDNHFSSRPQPRWLTSVKPCTTLNPLTMNSFKITLQKPQKSQITNESQINESQPSTSTKAWIRHSSMWNLPCKPYSAGLILVDCIMTVWLAGCLAVVRWNHPLTLRIFPVHLRVVGTAKVGEPSSSEKAERPFQDYMYSWPADEPDPEMTESAWKSGLCGGESYWVSLRIGKKSRGPLRPGFFTQKT